MSPRVSVVTIFLDPGSYLEAAADSVLSQTHGDLEYLLVDDGSGDGSSERARALAARHPDRVRYLQHPGHANRGMSASRNLGIEAARGELVAFLDADDVWLPDALERQLRILDRHPQADAVIGATLYWHSWDHAATEPDLVFRMGVTGLRRPPELASGLLTRGVHPPSINACVARREALRAIGGFEEGFVGLFEDQALLFKLLLARPVVVHEQVIDRYRQHDASACARGLAEGSYRLVGPSPARLAFRRFAWRHVDTDAWRGSEVWHDARRALAAERHPRREALRRRLGPGLLRRVGRRLARRDRSTVRLGSLRRLSPISRSDGYDRGRPVDRRYIERFYARYADDIRGRVLEVGDATYTRRFGDATADVDVLDVAEGNREATVVGDLAGIPQIADDTYDCIVLAQTLHLIADVEAAVGELHRILRPGGVVLATVPGISPVTDEQGWRHHWGFTDWSASRLFGTRFGEVVVETHGNVLAATAFLYGLADDELTAAELDRVDRRYPVTVTVRALKAARPG